MKTMILTWACGLLFGACGWSTAHAGPIRTLTLELRDRSGQPIEGAVVTFFEDQAPSCTTDAKGRCERATEFPYLSFSAVKTGYSPVRTMYELADRYGSVSVMMRAAPSEPGAKGLPNSPEEVRKAMIGLTDDLDLCAIGGHLFRGGSPSAFPPFLETDRDDLMREFAKRKLSFNRAQAKDETLVRGMSECSMAASYGKPSKRNRSVGPWGVRVQYVYEELGMYVYTRNGRVDSWQD